MHPIKKEKNAKQSIFNEKYEIVLHTPHSDAWCPASSALQSLVMGNNVSHFMGWCCAVSKSKSKVKFAFFCKSSNRMIFEKQKLEKICHTIYYPQMLI